MDAPLLPTAHDDPDYPARLRIDYPDRRLDRLSTLLRLLFALPIAVVLSSIGPGSILDSWDSGSTVGIGGTILFAPVLLMIVFRKKYPRWWFDFNLQMTRFATRVASYFALMSDAYPSTDEEQWVRLDIDYPDASRMNRFLPLLKWLLALPHYIVLALLGVGAFFAVVVAWFAILFTGRYPRGLFEYVEGVMRWWLRVDAYAFLLVTDRYPPFSLR